MEKLILKIELQKRRKSIICHNSTEPSLDDVRDFAERSSGVLF